MFAICLRSFKVNARSEEDIQGQVEKRVRYKQSLSDAATCSSALVTSTKFAGNGKMGNWFGEHSGARDVFSAVKY